MGFRHPDCGLLTEVYFLKMTIPNGNLDTPNDNLNGDACCKSTADQQEEVKSNASSIETLDHTTNVTIDSYASAKKKSPN
jgi:hypothetical protein